MNFKTQNTLYDCSEYSVSSMEEDIITMIMGTDDRTMMNEGLLEEAIETQ